MLSCAKVLLGGLLSTTYEIAATHHCAALDGREALQVTTALVEMSAPWLLQNDHSTETPLVKARAFDTKAKAGLYVTHRQEKAAG